MLGFPILCCKGMSPMMFQLSGFCHRIYVDATSFLKPPKTEPPNPDGDDRYFGNQGQQQAELHGHEVGLRV